MNRTSLRRTLTGSAAALALTVSLTACSGDDPDRSEASDAAAPTDATAEPIVEETSAAALPITDHVLGVDGLPGFAADGTPEAQTVREFATAHEKTVAELRRSGLRSGSTLTFEGDEFEGFALSIAAAYVDAAAAETEAERLFTSNTVGDPAIEARPLSVPGVPGVRAASLHGSEDGTRLTGVEIVFVDGDVTHEVFAVGEAKGFDLDAVIAAVTELHARVAGHPLAAVDAP